MPSLYDRFNLVSDFELAGDQARAIGELLDGLERGDPHQGLLGVTGSGKTFTMAQTIARVNRPTLVMVHNKTLAAQLYQEFRRFFPDNAVEYFVSYYDYYQPEAYVPATDSYIEKEATINEEIDRMRLSATRSLFERRDVIIVASVSCIYGLGSPEAYYGMLLPLERGQRISRDQILRKLVEIQYERNDHDFARGTFRVRGDIVEVIPSYEEQGLRIELIVDESHQTVPQIRGMYHGDRSRKEVLVAYGFRLPSALDNRPLNFEEWEARVRQVIHVSATPGPYELRQAQGVVVEQIIRPTGLIDPPIEVRPVKGQVDDLLQEIRARVERRERVLVTTLTKRMAEDLTQYYQELGVRVRYLHSDIETLERIEILRDLRRGEFDVLVGINLLREGLDLPEVSLVAILNADKEGFLRSSRSLIQTIGRAARNVNGVVILYADSVTESMRTAINETGRRRAIQHAFNEAHGITPQSIVKQIDDVMSSVYERDYMTPAVVADGSERFHTQAQLDGYVAGRQAEMRAAAAN